MPELPDVEVFRRYLTVTALHKQVASVEVGSRRVLQGTTPAALQRRAKGRRLRSTRRHGKYLFVALGGRDWLVLHFGMTGFLKYFKDPEQAPDHVRVALRFANGYRLGYASQRMLGAVGLTRSVEAFLAGKGLGPDALDLDFAAFHERLSGSRAAAKPALMDQGRLAGIGNVYADEILFQAGIHPARKWSALAPEEAQAVFRALREVLQQAIACKADPERMPAASLLPHRRRDGRCFACGRPLRRRRLSGRTTYYCPRKQPRR